MAWPTPFLKALEQEGIKWAGSEQEVQELEEQVERCCQGGSSDALVQRLLSVAKEHLTPDSEFADTFKQLQKAADAVVGLDETEETQLRFNASLHALENMREKMFQRSYNAVMDLGDFEGSIAKEWLWKHRASEHSASQRDALFGMSYLLRNALKHFDEQAIDPTGAAVEDDAGAVKQGPVEGETNESHQGTLVATAHLPEDAPAYIPVTFEVGASSCEGPLPLPRESMLSSVSLPGTLPSTSSYPQAEPAVITGFSFRNDFAVVTRFAAAQTIEAKPNESVEASGATSGSVGPGRSTAKSDVAFSPINNTGSSKQPDPSKVCDDEGASCTKGPTSSDSQLIKSKGKPEPDLRSLTEDKRGGRSSEAPNDETKEMNRAVKASADPDSDMDENRFEYLQKNHLGSAQHPHNCKACHFQGGLCWKGMDCTFCHLCPKPKRKSKHQRDVDKRRQERYLQVQNKLGEECCEVLAAIDDGRRIMMTSSEDLKRRVKEAYESKDPVRISEVNQVVSTIQQLVSALAIEDAPQLVPGQ